MRNTRYLKCHIMFIVGAAILVSWAVAGARRSRGAIGDPNAPRVESSTESNDLGWDLARAFQFTLDAVEVSTKLSTAPDSDSIVRTLTVSLTVDILDVARLVSIDIETPGVVGVFDSDGNIVECEGERYSPVRRYEDFAGWGTLTKAERSRSFDVTLALSGGGSQAIPSSISLLTAYIYAMYADDVIAVDVPFDRNGGCVETETSPSLLCCIDRRTPPCPGVYNSSTPAQLYKYETWVRTKTNEPMMTLRDAWPWYPRDGYPLGNYAVVRTELFDSKKKTTCYFQTQWVQSDPSGKQGTRCWGQIEQVPTDAYDTIRHIIAVRPVEVKIPLVLRDVPVPGLQPQAAH